MREMVELDELLVRWHKWSCDPIRSTDHRMVRFDALVGSLGPSRIAALIVIARNLTCSVAVWSSVRAGDKRAVSRARSDLLRKLIDDDLSWFVAAAPLKLTQRGNRVGDSNPSAKVADRDVELCVQMREQIDPATGRRLYSLGQLALRFRVPKSTVQMWCNGSRRGQAAARVKTV